MSVAAHLTALESAGLIRLIASQPDLEYLFRHALVQEAAYNSLVKTDRRILHRLAGEALEGLFPAQERPREMAPLLAQHFEEAGEDARALAYYHAAGEAAAVVYANLESVAHHLRAVGLARRLPPETLSSAAEVGHSLKDVFLGCGRALQRVGQYDEAVALYEEVRKLARDRRDQPLEMAALTSLANVRSIPSPAFSPTEGEALSAQALVLARALGDREAEARMLWNVMLVRFFSGREDGLREHGEQALAIARELDFKEIRAYVLNDLAGYVYTQAGEQERADAALVEARAVWREMGNFHMLADNLLTAALNGYVCGDYPKALALLDEAAPIIQRTHNIWGRAYGECLRGSVLLERGPVDAALAAFAAAMEAGEHSFVPAQVITGANQSVLYTWLGAPAQALTTAQAAVAKADAQVQFWRPRALGALALALLQRGEVEAAAEAVATGLATSHLERLYGYMTFLLLAECEVGLARGENERVALRAAELLANLRRRRLLSYVPHLLACQGRALAGLGAGRLNEARAALREAVEVAQSFGAAHVHWRALGALAHLEGSAGDASQAQALRRQARPIVEALAESTASVELRAALLAMPEARVVCAA